MCVLVYLEDALTLFQNSWVCNCSVQTTLFVFPCCCQSTAQMKPVNKVLCYCICKSVNKHKGRALLMVPSHCKMLHMLVATIGLSFVHCIEMCCLDWSNKVWEFYKPVNACSFHHSYLWWKWCVCSIRCGHWYWFRYETNLHLNFNSIHSVWFCCDFKLKIGTKMLLSGAIDYCHIYSTAYHVFSKICMN